MADLRPNEENSEYFEIDNELYKDLYKKIKVYLTQFSHGGDIENEYSVRFKEEFGLKFLDGHFYNIYRYIKHDKHQRHEISSWVSVVLLWIFTIVGIVYFSRPKMLLLIGAVFIALNIIITKIVKWYCYDKAIKYLCIAHLKQLKAELNESADTKPNL